MARQQRKTQNLTGFIEGQAPSSAGGYVPQPGDWKRALVPKQAAGMPKEAKVPDGTRVLFCLANDGWTSLVVYGAPRKDDQHIPPVVVRSVDPLTCEGGAILLKPVRDFARAPAVDAAVMSVVQQVVAETSGVAEDYDPTKPVKLFRAADGTPIPCTHWSNGAWGVYIGAGGAYIIKFADGSVLHELDDDAPEGGE